MASRHQVDDEGVEDRLKGLEDRLKSLMTTASRRRDDEGVEDRLKGLEDRLKSLQATASRRRDDEGVEDRLKGLEGRLKIILAGDQTPSLQRRPEAPASSSARQAEASTAQPAYERMPGLNASRHRIEGETTKEERERALLALIQEGRSMLPSKADLMAKIEEIKSKGNKERPSAATKKRGKRRAG